jgi:hypothetical protein
MLRISDGVCQKAGLPPDCSFADLIHHLEQNPTSMFDGLLDTDASRDAVLGRIVDWNAYNFVAVAQAGPLSRKFCAVEVAGEANLILVGLVDEQLEGALPTDLENLLFLAAVSPDLDWHLHWREDVLGWREKAKGMAIIGLPDALGNRNDALRLLSAIFSLDHIDLPIQKLPSPIAATSSHVKVLGGLVGYTSTTARLLAQAITESNPKWRCLSLYRILENAYLSNIKKQLDADFQKDAAKAVEIAAKSLKSELEQLFLLADNVGLANEFLLFNTAVETLIGVGNQFMIALDRSASTEVYYRDPAQYKKGVLRFYKLRCSIAHAGTSSVFYEQFRDADTAAFALLSSIEKIALKCAGLVV